jgi:predicted dehydrogenase
MIRIGVIGCANIAHRSMIPAILELKDKFKLVAVASRDQNKADSFAAEFSCEGIGSYEQLLMREDIDAVYIPLPTGLHKEWITKALNSGKHVYAEKSIAMNFQDAEEMVEVAVKRNLALMEGYMFQYHTQHQKVFELINNGTIGDIRSFKAAFGFPPFPNKNDFRYDNQVGGGALRDAAGYVVRAASFITKRNYTVEGASIYYEPTTKTSLYGNAFLASSDGVGAFLAFGFDNFYQCNYEIWGSKGKLTVKRAFTPKPNEVTALLVETANQIEEISCEPCNHFVKALEEFHSLCQGNQANKAKHYNEILLQSKTIDKIEEISKQQ